MVTLINILLLNDRSDVESPSIYIFNVMEKGEILHHFDKLHMEPVVVLKVAK